MVSNNVSITQVLRSRTHIFLIHLSYMVTNIGIQSMASVIPRFFLLVFYSILEIFWQLIKVNFTIKVHFDPSYMWIVINGLPFREKVQMFNKAGTIHVRYRKIFETQKSISRRTWYGFLRNFSSIHVKRLYKIFV